ncbi:rCG33953, isoform CRA_c [Rattus norvegicus]|uniref:RCG33953, isoform CRA_c n=1 Tax=Rattus norvegicus TaxID=10116 RepID=A6HKE7_RAT|nr:rCG33953, isoform CRA_c [Rattus norvegicus]
MTATIHGAATICQINSEENKEMEAGRLRSDEPPCHLGKKDASIGMRSRAAKDQVQMALWRK